MDCAGSTGTNGQVLTSNGGNAVCWGLASGALGSPFNAAANVGYDIGSVCVRVSSTSFAQITAASGTASLAYTSLEVQSGSTTPFVKYQGSTSIAAGTWVSVNQDPLTNAGETVTLNVINNTDGSAYTITYFRTASGWLVRGIRLI
jgi:hypothetical protein